MLFYLPCIESAAQGAGESAALGAGEAGALGASESAALGVGESALSGTAPAEALHTFTLDSGASRSFFRDCTTLTPLSRPVAVSLAYPSGGPVLAHSSTILPCPAFPSSSLSGLHLPLFSTNLVSGADLLDALVDQLTPEGAVARRSSLLLVSPNNYSPADPPHGPPRAVRDGLRVLRLHSGRGGEFASHFLREFCRGKGIRQTFTLPASPQQNGIAERRIGLVMEVARTSMVHDAAPHFLWLFAVRYGAHHLNPLAPCLLARDLAHIALDGEGWQCVSFYHPTSHRVLPSENIMLDESVPFYRLFPYRTASLPPPPLLLAPGPPPVDPLPPQGPAPSGVSQVDAVKPVKVAFDSNAATEGGAAGGAEPERAEFGGAEPNSVELGGAKPGVAGSEGVVPGGAESEGAAAGGAEPGGAEPRGADCASGLLTTGDHSEMLLELELLEVLLVQVLLELELLEVLLEELELLELAVLPELELLEVLLVQVLLEVLEPLDPEVLVLEILELLGLVLLPELELEVLGLLLLEVLLALELLEVLEQVVL
ncbi:unnamed protein product [Closterium sp. NIES-65]|nr:unnamed protein product [Closterium sp. NIES-65]